MSISYSWQIEDMKWDNSTGMVVSVNAAYIGTYNGLVDQLQQLYEHKGIIITKHIIESNGININTK